MPVHPDLVPSWVKPENASVMDDTWTTVARAIAHLMGADTASGALQGSMPASVAVPNMGEAGGIAGLVEKFMKGRGSLARTVQKTGERGVYGLHPDTVTRLGQMYDVGTAMPTTANWEGQTDELIRAFGGDQEKARQWLRLWGATSPNTAVPVNTRESLSALLYAMQHPNESLTVPAAQALEPAKITMAPSKVPNINRALAGQPLSGDKVEAMSGFMVGDPRIPIDVHALHALGSNSDKLSPEIPGLRAAFSKAEKLPIGKGGLNDTQIYLRYEQALKDALQGLEPGRSVNSIFATTWEGARTSKGLKPQGGPIDILRKKGLLEAGAMLDPERLKAVLKTAGWSAGAIAAVLAGIQSDPGAAQ